jgi:hypothetical protein
MSREFNYTDDGEWSVCDRGWEMNLDEGRASYKHERRGRSLVRYVDHDGVTGVHESISSGVFRTVFNGTTIMESLRWRGRCYGTYYIYDDGTHAGSIRKSRDSYSTVAVDSYGEWLEKAHALLHSFIVEDRRVADNPARRWDRTLVESMYVMDAANISSDGLSEMYNTPMQEWRASR